VSNHNPREPVCSGNSDVDLLAICHILAAAWHLRKKLPIFEFFNREMKQWLGRRIVMC